MRVSLAFAVVVAVLAAPASAALDPGVLVLRQADVPAGFRFDEGDSGVSSNARRAKDSPEFRPVMVRSGRLTGYEAVFANTRSSAAIESLADVFRAPEGARMVLLWFDREVRRASPAPLKRTATGIGAQGWVYRGSKPLRFTLVAWREGPVFGAVFGIGVSTDTTLALARTQERRIAAALR